jgi:hypothetical protein
MRDNINIVLLIFCIILIIGVLFIYKKTNIRESFIQDSYFNKILNEVNSYDYDKSSSKLALRINLDKSQLGTDTISLTNNVLEFYKNLLYKICNENINFKQTISRTYYNKEIGPQLYWMVVSSNNKDIHNDDVLSTLGLIEITIFQGNKINVNNNTVEINDDIKNEIDASSNFITTEDLNKLLINYVNNLFNMDYIKTKYAKLKNISDENTINAFSRVANASVNIIKEDSVSLCTKLIKYLLNQDNFITMQTRYQGVVKDMYKLKSKFKKLSSVMKFNEDDNIFINNILDNIRQVIPNHVEIEGIYFPMTNNKFNTLKIIPLFIIKSDLSDIDKKYYIGLFAMLHYAAKTSDLSNLKNYINNQPITLDEKIRELLKIDKEILSPEDVQNTFYIYYSNLFKNLISYQK